MSFKTYFGMNELFLSRVRVMVNPETKKSTSFLTALWDICQLIFKQDACYTGITRDAVADSFIPTVCFADL